MIIFYLVLLLPLMAISQDSFGPMRLDDSLAQRYFYPALKQTPSGNLLCAWAQTSDSLIAVYGQTVALNGSLVGQRITYQSVRYGEGNIVCPASIALVHESGGGEARMIYHS